MFIIVKMMFKTTITLLYYEDLEFIVCIKLMVYTN